MKEAHKKRKISHGKSNNLPNLLGIAMAKSP